MSFDMITIPGQSAPVLKIRFTKLIERFIIAIEAGQVLTNKGDHYKSSSISNYRALLQHVIDFEKELGFVLYVDRINITVSDRFLTFLVNRGLKKNSVAAIGAKYKAIIRRAYAAGLTSFAGVGIHLHKEDSPTIFTTLSELKAMYNYDYTDNPARDMVRDIYVMNCFIGMRISDLRAFLRKPMNFITTVDGVDVIKYVAIKTNRETVVPMSSIVRKILEKRSYDFGRGMSAQNFNKVIKSIYYDLFQNETVKIVQTLKGERKEMLVLKYTMVASHTARRTFATLAELSDMPRNAIMQMTGHGSESSYLKYVRNTSLQNALRVRNHIFFKIKL
jgi:integrase